MGDEFYQNNFISGQEEAEYREYEGNFFLIDRGVLKDVRIETELVRIPEDVVEVRRQAFLSECLGGRMEILVIPETVRKIEKLAFAGMDRLREVEIKIGLTSLEPGVFRNCADLEKVILSKSLVRIKSRAFENCTRLEEVVLLSRVVRIAEDAFANCFRLKNAQIEEAVAEEKELRMEEEARARLARFPHLVNQKKEEELAAKKALKEAKEQEAKEAAAIAPATVGDKAKGTESVVKSVGEFLRATIKGAIKEVIKDTEGEKRKENAKEPGAGAKAFEQKNAGQMVLEAPPDAEELLLQQGINIGTEFCICDGVLERCEIGCRHIVVPATVKKIAPEAFSGSENKELLERLDLPEGLEEIMDQAFYGLTNLEEIRIPSTLRYIGAGAFEGTVWLEEERKRNAYVVVNGILISAYFESMAAEAKLPDTVWRIAPYAFYRSEAQLVVFPESVAEVDAYAFVESGVTEIDFSTRAEVEVHTPLAARCENLKEIYIPGKLERLDAGFVEECPALKRVCVKWKETMVHKQAFDENVRIWVL